MKKFTFNFLILIFAGWAISITGCAPGAVQFTTSTTASIAESTPKQQSQGGITIQMDIIDAAEYSQSYLTQPITAYVGKYSAGADANGMATVNENLKFFAKMTPFKVRIINDTKHILRMRDSRVIFVAPDSDEPLVALSKESIMEDISSLPSYKFMADVIKNKYPETQPTYLLPQITTGFNEIVKKIKFINGFNREIMPGMKLEGIIVFPIDTKIAAEGKVSFIDMVSVTDDAGNPVKKERFDYRVSTLDRYWRYDPKTDKNWTEVSKDEYNAGNTATK